MAVTQTDPTGASTCWAWLRNNDAHANTKQQAFASTHAGLSQLEFRGYVAAAGRLAIVESDEVQMVVQNLARF